MSYVQSILWLLCISKWNSLSLWVCRMKFQCRFTCMVHFGDNKQHTHCTNNMWETWKWNCQLHFRFGRVRFIHAFTSAYLNGVQLSFNIIWFVWCVPQQHQNENEICSMEIFSLPYFCRMNPSCHFVYHSCNLLFFFFLDLRVSLSLYLSPTLFVSLCVLCTCCVPFLPIQIECFFYVYHFICHPRIAFIYRTTFIQYIYPIVFGCVVFTLVLSVQLFGAKTEAAMLRNVGKIFELYHYCVHTIHVYRVCVICERVCGVAFSSVQLGGQK